MRLRFRRARRSTDERSPHRPRKRRLDPVESMGFAPLRPLFGGLLPLILIVGGGLSGCREETVADADLLEQATQAVEERRYDEALSTMRQLIERHPDDPHTQRLYGEVLIATGQPSLAVWPLSRAMKDPEETIPAGLLLARAQLAGGSDADAIKTATRVIDLDPDNAMAYLLRARAHLSQNMEEETIADIDAAIARGVEDDTIEFMRLLAYLGQGEVEQAEQLLETLHSRAVEEVESNPRRAAEVCAATAMFAYESGDRPLAEERFAACLDDRGLRNRLLVDTALRFYDEIALHDQGTDILRRRFEADERNLTARVEYAERLRRGRKGEEAEALLLEAAGTQPAAWAALVDFYVRGEEFVKALDALDRAIEANPDPPDGWYMSRADFLIILGRLDEARRSLADVKLEVHRAVIEGRLMLARGELRGAARRLEEALGMWPDNPDVRYLAGHAYERLGDWGRAASHFREAARMDPPHAPSSRALADIQKAVGDGEGRAFVLHRLLEVDPFDADAIEGVLDQARAAGAIELTREMFARLSEIPGMRGRAIANVARARAKAGGPEAGLKAIDAAGADLAAPDLFEALEARVGYLEALGQRRKAIAQVDTLLARRAESSDLHALRGRLRLSAGDLAAAQQDLQRAVELDPDSLRARLGLAAVEEAAGNLPGARTQLEQAVDLEREATAHESEAALALARFEIRSGETEAGRDRLRAILEEHPRHGEAALALADSLLEEGDPESPSVELVDVARRAALFEASPRARQLSARLAPKPSDAGRGG